MKWKKSATSKKEEADQAPVEVQTTAMVVSERNAPVPTDPVVELKNRVDLIRRVQKEVMRPGVDYGVIPGCGNKPTLLKPGAEKLIVTFRLCPEVNQTEERFPDGHLNVITKVRLLDIQGHFLGDGIGSCSTMESKYRYRWLQTEKRPLKDESEKLKAQGLGRWKKGYNGNWVWCERSDNPDMADSYNTVRKMSAKRARVDATLSVTGVSDLFTQDIEEFHADDDIPEEPASQPANENPAHETAAVRPVDTRLQTIIGKLKKKDPKTWTNDIFMKELGERGATRLSELSEKDAVELCGLYEKALTEKGGAK
jgi:hypothetical protein